MGWDYIKGVSKAELVKRLVSPKTFAVYMATDSSCSLVPVRHKVVGSTLWTLQVRESRSPAGVKSRLEITCHLLARKTGFGWGVKSLSAESHPYYYDCPVDYLDYQDDAGRTASYCPAWAEKVREYDRKERMVLRDGQVFTLVNCVVPEVRLAKVSGRVLYGVCQKGKLYKLKRSFLGEEVPGFTLKEAA